MQVDTDAASSNEHGRTERLNDWDVDGDAERCRSVAREMKLIKADSVVEGSRRRAQRPEHSH